MRTTPFTLSEGGRSPPKSKRASCRLHAPFDSGALRGPPLRVNVALTALLLLLSLACGRPGGGTGTVSGKADGVTEFGQVQSALWIGRPDSASETLFYLFSKPVSCSEITAVGWDGRIPLDAQFFEVVAKDTITGEYPVMTGAQQMQGEVVHTLVRTGAELDAMSGMLSITRLDQLKGAKGSFDVTFPASGTSTASFIADWCADGVEP